MCVCVCERERDKVNIISCKDNGHGYTQEDACGGGGGDEEGKRWKEGGRDSKKGLRNVVYKETFSSI